VSRYLRWIRQDRGEWARRMQWMWRDHNGRIIGRHHSFVAEQEAAENRVVNPSPDGDPLALLREAERRTEGQR
jgi:hypothetical protein